MLRSFPCGGTTLLEESFDNGIPADWMILDLDGQAPNDYLQNIVNGGGWQGHVDFKDNANQVAISPSWYQDTIASEDWLILPKVGLGTNTCLSWYAYSQDRYFPEDYEVRISTTTPDTTGFFAEEALAIIEDESYPLDYRSVNLAAYANDSVYIAFRHISKDQFILVLDDVRLAEVETNDLSILNLRLPDVGDTLQPMDTVRIKAALVNYGSDTLVADSLVQVNYAVNGGSVQTAILSDSIVLAPNDTMEFVHAELWAVPSDQIGYEICMWASGVNDQNASNDTLCIWVGVGTATKVDESLFDVGFIRVYPNPAQDFLQIERTIGQNTLQFALYDLSGKMIGSLQTLDAFDNQTQMSLASFPKGLYFLRVWDEEGHHYTAKIIKQ